MSDAQVVMEGDIKTPSPYIRDAVYMVARVVACIALLLIGAAERTRIGLPVDGSAVALPITVLLITSLVLAAFIFVKSIAQYNAYAIMICDGLLAASLAWLIPAVLPAQPEMRFIVLVTAVIMLCALPQASLTISGLQAVGVLVGVLLGLFISSGTGLIDALAADFTPLIALVAVTGLILLVAYGLDAYLGVLRREVQRADRTRAAEEDALQQRNRAIYDLTFAMTSSIKYERILEAALEAGRLGVRSPERDAQNMVAAVMLFHADDNMLHIVSGRRLSRPDSAQILPGKSGILGQALRDAEPIIGAMAARDPELQYLSGFQHVRSVLAVPLRAGFDNFGLLVYGSERANAFTPEQLDLLSSVGLQATIALQNALLYRSLQDERDRIVEVEEEARKKLARDLHDGPTQSISAIAMRMSYVQRLITKQPEKVPEELRKIEEISRNATKEIRHMLFTLRPLVLETQGLGEALKQLAEKLRDTHGQNVVVRIGRDIEALLDHNQQGVVFYIVEEAINNARKHAQATQITVTVARQNEMFIVQIVDNGVGFDTNAVNSNYESRGSLGMVNMRERAELLEGRLTVESVPGRGTAITVVAPLRSRSPEAAKLQEPTTLTKLQIAANERIAQTSEQPRSS